MDFATALRVAWSETGAVDPDRGRSAAETQPGAAATRRFVSTSDPTVTGPSPASESSETRAATDQPSERNTPPTKAMSGRSEAPRANGMAATVAAPARRVSDSPGPGRRPRRCRLFAAFRGASERTTESSSPGSPSEKSAALASSPSAVPSSLQPRVAAEPLPRSPSPPSSMSAPRLPPPSPASVRSAAPTPPGSPVTPATSILNSHEAGARSVGSKDESAAPTDAQRNAGRRKSVAEPGHDRGCHACSPGEAASFGGLRFRFCSPSSRRPPLRPSRSRPFRVRYASLRSPGRRSWSTARSVAVRLSTH